jgi:hypothetical protein
MHAMILPKAVLRRDDKPRRVREPLVLGTVGTCTKIEGSEVPATKSSGRVSQGCRCYPEPTAILDGFNRLSTLKASRWN